MEGLMNDFRYRLRVLAANPRFSVAIILTLALGIGANTAIFSLVNALFIRSLPGIVEPDQVVHVGRANGEDFDTVSYPNYMDYRDRNNVFSSLAVYNHTQANISTGRETAQYRTGLVSGNYFTTLGTTTTLGRTLLPEDDQAVGASPVAVISHTFWTQQFGTDPGILGQEILVNGFPLTIIGVAEPGFERIEIVHNPTVLWLPLTMALQVMPGRDPTFLTNRRWNGMMMIGRLKPGVSIANAQAGMNVIVQQLRTTFPEAFGEQGIRVEPFGLLPFSRRMVEDMLLPLFAITGLILLLACFNTANLLLVHTIKHMKEIGIRLSLGASRWRLIRQSLLESLLLALLGGCAGLILAFWLTDLLWSYAPRWFVPDLDVNPDSRVFAATLLLSVLTGLLSGLIPAIKASKPNLIPILKDTSSPVLFRRFSWQQLFVIGQVTLSLVIIVCASLFLRTLWNAQSIPLGFDADRILTVSTQLNARDYDATSGRLFYQQLIDRISGIPGVSSVSLADNVPFLGRASTSYEIDGVLWSYDYYHVGPDFLQTLGTPILRGRDLSDRDTKNAPPVAVINETMANRYLAGVDPVGQRFTFGGHDVQVVGVVRDITGHDVWSPPNPHAYIPFLQSETQQMFQTVTLYIRTATDPTGVMSAVRNEIRNVDPNVPVFYMQTLEDRFSKALSAERMRAMLVSLFGVLALILATFGLYALIANLVSQRTKEIGVRMALGAKQVNVLGLFIRQGMFLTVIGLVLGIIAALSTSQILSSMLYGINATDLPTYAVISVLLMAVAFIACYIPAHRASRVDPMEALRYE